MANVLLLIQVCDLTFVSWTESAIDIDLVSDKEPHKLIEDAEAYFVNTGEWKLSELTVRKVVSFLRRVFVSNSLARVPLSDLKSFYNKKCIC